MLFMWSGIGMGIILIQENINIKKNTWDCIPKGGGGALAFKTLTGTVTYIINYSVTKYIPLTIISVVNNLSPIIVIVMAFLILKE